MFDAWLGIGDINFTSLMMIVSLVVVLPLQIWLCFKGKSVWIRLAPMILFALLELVFLLLGFSGWQFIVFLYFAVCTAFMLFACGVGWLVWAGTMLVRKLRKK